MPNKPFNIDKSDYEDHLNDRGKYFRVPNEIWVVQVDAFARIIWMYIFSQKPTWPSSMKNIARNLGMHEDTVKKHLRKLEEVKMIVVDRSSPKGWRFYIPPVSKWKDDLGEVEERYSKILAASDGASPKFGAQVEKQPQVTGPIKDYSSSGRLDLERKEKLLYPLDCKETDSIPASSPKNQVTPLLNTFSLTIKTLISLNNEKAGITFCPHW